ALAGLSYTPTAQYNGSATLTLLTSDLGNTGSGGTLTDSDTVAITVNAVNDAPVNSVPGAQSVNEDGSLVFSSGNGNLISISDVDAASGSMQVTLSVTNGTLSLSGTSGLSFSSGDGTADATMTFSGTVSAINTALAGLIYTPTAQYNGSATLTLITSDQGNTGSGGTLTDSDTVAITVNAVNDAPVNSVPGAQSVNEDDTLVFSSGNGNLISISDVDAASGSLQVTLSVTNGSLTLSGTSGLSFSNGDGTGDTTMTFSGTASAINTALAGLIYTPTAQYNGNATLTLQTSDLGNTGSGGPLTDSDTVAITVNAVNDAPVNSVPGAQSVNEDTALVFSSGNGNLISIADVDNGTMQVTLSVTNGSLTLSGTSGLTFSNGDGTSDATMTFTGSVSAINTALAGLIYMPTADVNGSATLTLLTSDLGNTGSGGPLTDSDTVAITVNAVNDAPVNSVPGAQSVNEDTNKVFSVANGNLISISDVDAGSSTMRVTIAATLGRTTLSTTAGLTFTAGDGTSDATMTFSGTASAINTALAGLIYRGNANVSGAGSITITTSDLGNTGSGGTLTDVDTIAVTINAVNDAPVNTKPGAQTVNEDTALVFSTANGNSISIADVDAGASAMQVTVSVTNGSLSLSGTTGLSFSVGDGSADTTMTFTGTLTNINNSLAGLSFNPTGDFNGAATLTIVTSDQGNTGSGGARSDTDTVAITVTAVNDAPVATITPPSYNATEQLALALQGTGLSISDVDAASGMLQATLSVASGTLTIAAGSTGVIVTGSGSNSVTLDGTLAQINALLAGTGGATISYVIASDTPPATDTLTLLISDLGNTGSGGILSASDTALINIAAVNDTPGVSITAPLYTVIESRSVSLHGSGLSVSDPDGGGIAAQVTLSVDLGTLTVLPGSTGVGVAGSGTGTVTLTGTIDQINALLDGTGAATISYTNDSGIPLADATLTLGINDLGNTGSGGALTASGSVLIDVIPPASMGSVLVPGISQGAIGAFYGFDATTALGRDDSGGGHDITLTGGASQTAGADGRQSALLLPGGGEGGDIAGLTTGGATTLATWVRFDATGTGDRVIDLGQASGAGIGNMVIARDGSSDQISFIIDVGGTQYTVSSAAGAITNGQWMHVAGTVDGTGLMTLYVNGAVAGSAQGVVLASGVRDHHYVGLSNTPGADSLQGAVNDLLILNQALTASQIAALAQAGGPSVQERAANGTVVGTVVSSSSNLGASISYTLSNSAGGRFTIDASTGVITVANGSALQHDLSSSHIITVRSTDVSDGSALDVNYTITLININDAPQGADTTVTLSEDGQHVFGLSDFGFGDVNDSSANQLLAVKISSLPLAGSLTLDGVAVNAGDTLLASDIALGKLVFTPAANAAGNAYASFGFQVQDDGGTALGGIDLDPTVRTLTLNVSAVNDAPLGSDATVQGTEDTPYVFSIGDFGFSDLEGHAFVSVTISSLPLGGTLTLDGVAVQANDVILSSDIALGKLVFTPTAQANGTAYAQMGFRVHDDGGVALGGVDMDVSVRTLTLDISPVNDAPMGSDGTLTVAEDSDHVLQASDFGFSDPDDGGAHQLQGVRFNVLPDVGTLTLNGVAVTVDQVVSLADINAGLLRYRAMADDNGVGYTRIGFHVQDDGGTALGGQNEDPVQRTLTVDVTPVNDAPVTIDTGASGAEDTPIAGLVTGSDIDGDALSFTLGSGPTRGSVVVAADGSFVYTPDANVHGGDSFTVIVSDGQGGSATSTVSITVTPVNDAPITLDTSASGAEDASISGAVIGSDVDGDTLSFALGSGPTRGSVVVAADGSFVYTPDANVNGSDSFTVIVSDGQGGSATSTVSVSITPVNDSPVGQDASASGAEDTVLTGVVSGSDVDGDALSYSLASGPTHGSVAVAADGSFSYTPAADFHGNDSFTVTVSDGQGGSSTCTVTLTLTPVNDAPVSADLGVAGLEDVALSGQLAGSDVDGDVPVFALASGPTHGQVTVGSDGGFTYVPTAHHHGQDSFTVSVSDGQGGQVISTVTLTLSPVNDAPTSQNLTLTGTQDQPLPGTVSGTDVDGDPLGFSLGTAPLHGSVSLGGNGAFTYTPTAQFTGSDSFTVVLSDGQGGSTLSTVSITVLPRVVMPPMGPPITVDPPVAPTTPIDMNPPGAGEGSNGGTTEEPVTEPGPQEPPPQEGGDEGTTDGPGGQGQDPVAVTPNRPGVGGGPLNDAGAGGADARQLGRLLLSAGGSWFTLQPREFEVPTFNLMAIEMSPVPSGISIMPSTPLSTGDIAFSLQGNRQTDSGPSMPWGLDKVSAEQLQVSGTVLSIGAVWWISRGATLISSLLLTTPVWRQIDPLPVFSQGRTRFDEEEPPSRHGDSDGSDGSDSDSDRAMNARAEGMFDQREENQPHSIG
ncbi:MAG TPA: Ig-like domain-containing protein, partial [Aquabacterium sp.]|uniref:tandem-95 repeat protein n=1 Tax=Aquabacterium sp. TaxID=1872578 RepID=UPI002E353AC4